MRTSAPAPAARAAELSIAFSHLRRRRVGKSNPMLVPKRRSEYAVAQPHRFRGNLDQFFLVDPLESRIESRDPRRREPHRLIVASGAHVSELLFTANVD